MDGQNGFECGAGNSDLVGADALDFGTVEDRASKNDEVGTGSGERSNGVFETLPGRLVYELVLGDGIGEEKGVPPSPRLRRTSIDGSLGRKIRGGNHMAS